MTHSAADTDPTRRGQRLPLRLKLKPDEGEASYERVLKRPFRLGFGETCDIRLDGTGGPEVVFQVEQTQGPLLIASALPPEEFENYLEIKVNGEPLRQAVQELPPGAHLDIVDRTTKRRYQLVVDPRSRHYLLRPRSLAVLLTVAVLVGCGVAAYLYLGLRGTRSDIERTTQRVEHTEAKLEQTAQELIDSVGRMGSADVELERAIRELAQLQADSAQQIRVDFTQRLFEIKAQTRDAVTRVAEADTEQRAQLAAQAQKQIDALREEFSTRMVESYQRLKALEERLHATMSERFAERASDQTHLKKLLLTSRDAVLFIRTRYKVTFRDQQEATELSGFGTGYLLGGEGLAMTAQHVMFPWRYDQELSALIALGLAKLVPESVRWNAWSTGAKVLADPGDNASFDDATSFDSAAAPRDLRMVFVPRVQHAPAFIRSPIGIVEIAVPVMGPTDVAVFQLRHVGEPLAQLALSGTSSAVEALDEVLVLGYPYSRLKDGIAWPQAVRGFVRQVGNELLEIDAAVHPGLSGGPLLSTDGTVLGMVTAIVSSEVYGTALRARDLRKVLDRAHAHILAEEHRLSESGCDPGAVDGVFDGATWQGYDCESARTQSRTQ